LAKTEENQKEKLERILAYIEQIRLFSDRFWGKIENKLNK
jgi:hypothetical protein